MFMRYKIASLTTIFMLVAVLVWAGSTVGPHNVMAQGASCPDIVKKALDTANRLCDGAKRNQACYGNVQASAEARPGASIKFTAPGDIAQLADIQAIGLAGYDASGGTWGVALMRIQPSNLPDTAAGQDVTVLVFGDTQLQNASGGPMQAFYFRTGVGAPACKEMPPDGVLLKTPAGSQKVQLVVNGVQLNVGSEVFLQARSDKPLPSNLSPATASAATPAGSKRTAIAKLVIHTIKGSVDVTANGKTQTVSAGMESSVDIGEDWEAVDAPAEAHPDELTYDPHLITVLEDVEVPGPGTAEPEATVEPEQPTVEPSETPPGDNGGSGG
jgi:hypothetical protein